MFKLISLVFKYLFIIIIYFFIYSIIKLIYLDIRGLSFITSGNEGYIELLNDIEAIPYLIKEYYVLNREINIGRSLNNDIVIEDPYVSKHNTKLFKLDGKYIIKDLNSANGTYLNGKKLLGATELKSGDVLKVGDLEFKFKNK